MKHCYTAIGLFYFSNQKKIIAKFAVQVCGSKKSFAVAKVQKITANVPQTCGFCEINTANLWITKTNPKFCEISEYLAFTRTHTHTHT